MSHDGECYGVIILHFRNDILVGWDYCHASSWTFDSLAAITAFARSLA